MSPVRIEDVKRMGVPDFSGLDLDDDTFAPWGGKFEISGKGQANMYNVEIGVNAEIGAWGQNAQPQRDISGVRTVVAGDMVAVIDRIGYNEATDTFIGCAIIKDRETGNSRRICVEVDCAPIRKLVMGYLHKWHQNEHNQEIGNLDDVFKTIQSIGSTALKVIGVDRIAQEVKTAIGDKDVQQAVKVGPSVFAPFGLDFNSVSQAAQIIEDYRRGSPDERTAAVAQLQTIALMARDGNPAAKRMAIALNAIYKTDKLTNVSAAEQADKIKDSLDDARRGNKVGYETIGKLDEFYGIVLSSKKPSEKQHVAGLVFNDSYSPSGDDSPVCKLLRRQGHGVSGEGLGDSEVERY